MATTNNLLDLFWLAKFKDGSQLMQYDKDGNEIAFKEVLDRQEQLKYFALVRRTDSLSYIVDLKLGTISQAKRGEAMFEPRQDMLRKEAYEYRLIYFREVEREFGSSMQPIGEPKTVYFLGFQYKDKNGSNNKRMIKIHKDGQWVVN